MAKTVLFLDYDGVLHPDAAYMVKGVPVLKSDGELFMWAPLLVDTLADYPQIQIVLSTSWARMLSFNAARDWLPQVLHERTIGATWHSMMGANEPYSTHRLGTTGWDQATRYEQIKQYVHRAGATLTDWLAVDDDAEGWADAEQHKLVHTPGDTGLSDPVAMVTLKQRLSTMRGLS